MHIALATCRELPTLDADDHAYVDALRARGITVTLPVWNDEPFTAAASDGGTLDAVVVRSTWDYSEDRDRFVAWARAVDEQTRLLNPSSMVRWNTDKQQYLTDLAEQGVRTVPTVWLPRSSSSSSSSSPSSSPASSLAPKLAELVGAQGWKGVVLKPIFGAGSRDTIFVGVADLSTIGQRFVDEQLPKQALMVQPFLPRIKDGEVSLVYLDGALSHAVIKKPKAGDFRSQPEFGSQVSRHTPTTAERTLADHTLHIAGGRPLYARVDLVTGLDGQPTVIELEMVEPCLYLGWSDGAADRFADATIARAREAR